MLEGEIQAWDSRRDLMIPGDIEKTISFAAEHWIHTAKRSILERGRFAVALSGGESPKAIYHLLATVYRETIDWKKVLLFWSDERSVSPDQTESNFYNAMNSGLQTLPIPPSQIFRMKAEIELEKHAAQYEETIKRELGPSLFDLVMLGLGEDGHTASLFPKTTALKETKKLVVANFIPTQNIWRMTFTFPCIQHSQRVAFYVTGEKKQAIVSLVLESAILSPFPASAIGTSEKKALWILDHAAARLLPSKNG